MQSLDTSVLFPVFVEHVFVWLKNVCTFQCVPLACFSIHKIEPLRLTAGQARAKLVAANFVKLTFN